MNPQLLETKKELRTLPTTPQSIVRKVKPILGLSFKIVIIFSELDGPSDNKASSMNSVLLIVSDFLGNKLSVLFTATEEKLATTDESLLLLMETSSSLNIVNFDKNCFEYHSEMTQICLYIVSSEAKKLLD